MIQHANTCNHNIHDIHDIQGLIIRCYRRGDHMRVMTLYQTGRLSGQAPDEPIEDLLDIDTAYFTRPCDHLWVAEARGRVVGMVAAVVGEGRSAVIRRLRVDPAYRGTPVAACLIKAAVRHCWDHDALKVVLVAPIDPDDAATLLIDSGLRFNRTVTRGGRETFEFYVDLYHEPLFENDAAFDDHRPRVHFNPDHTQIVPGGAA